MEEENRILKQQKLKPPTLGQTPPRKNANVSKGTITDMHLRVFRQDFDQFDQDRSGFINAGTEFQKFLEQQRGRPISTKEADRYLKSMDTNVDGKISFDEYMASLFPNGYTVV